MSDQYLIVKRGLYYRPDSSGYTGIRDQAGRYDKAYAEECARLSDSISIVREEEAPEYSPRCNSDSKLEHVSKQLQAARERVEELETELSRQVSQHEMLIKMSQNDYIYEVDKDGKRTRKSFRDVVKFECNCALGHARSALKGGE